MDRRLRTILRGLAAAVALAALAVGVPVLLAREVGWPLPTAVPTWEEVARAITTGTVRDTTIIKTIAVLVWLAWADFTSGVAAELIGIARGRVAVRAGGLRTAQQLAARLVTTVAVAVSLLVRPTSGTAAPVDLRLAVADARVQPLAGSIGEGERGRPLLEPPEVGTSGGLEVSSQRASMTSVSAVHEVQRGDTLWDLAERYLGDGMRWRDLRAANVGRGQPDGERIGVDTEALHPGWTLLVPERSQEVAPGPADGSGHDRLVVKAGDTLWDLADEHLGDPHAWPRLHEENRGDRQPDGDALGDPDLIRPGWTLDVPPPPVAPTPTSEEFEPGPTVDPPVGPSAPEGPVEPAPEQRGAEASGLPPPPSPRISSTPPPSPPEVRDVAEPDAEESSEGVPVVPVAAAGTLAAGVVLTLDRLRRARLRRREPGHRIPLPDGEAAAVEQELRATADQAAARFLDHALRELSDHLAQLDDQPEVEHVTHDATTVTVQLDRETVPAPKEWVSEEPCVWSRHRRPDPDAFASAAGAPSLLPALVTLGRTLDDKVVLLNLARTRHLHVVGDAESAERLLAAWALELATTPRADALDVLATGIAGLPSGLERLHLLEDPDALREHLPDSAVRSVVPDTVVLSIDLAPVALDALSASYQRGVGTVAVTAATAPDERAPVLHLDGEGRARLEPMGVEVRRLALGQGTLPLTAKLLEQALHDPDQLVPLPPDPADELPAIDIDTTDDAQQDAAPTLLDEPSTEVRVLGPVEVVGAAQPFRTNKTVELVVYLALRRSGADTDTLLEALWPGQEPRPARLYTEASRARKALGAAADGTPHLPDAELGRYRLEPTVALDHERFATEVAAARRNPSQAAEHLRRALELVRGVPLSAAATEYAWATNEGYRLAQEVVDAAHDLSELALEAGRWDDCTWAAERGLLANPLAEVLVRDLMKAAAATGNTARVHAMMTRLRRQVAEDGDANDADDWLHPETVELFESLTGTMV